MSEKGVHYVDQLHNGLGLDVYRDGVHVIRIDNAGRVHIFVSDVLVRVGDVFVYKGGLQVKGDAQITGNLDVKGNLYVNGNISTKNACLVGGGLTVGGDITLYGTIVQDVSGAPPLINDSVPPTEPLPPLPPFPELEDKPL